MITQTNAATGHVDHNAKAAPQHEVMATLGASFARKYLVVMVICAWLVSQQVGMCQPPTLTT